MSTCSWFASPISTCVFYHIAVQRIGVARGSKKAMPPNFLPYLVVKCVERWCAEPNNICTPQKIFAPPKKYSSPSTARFWAGCATSSTSSARFLDFKPFVALKWSCYSRIWFTCMLPALSQVCKTGKVPDMLQTNKQLYAHGGFTGGIAKLFPEDHISYYTTFRGPDILRNVIVSGYVAFYQINKFFI